MTTHECWGDCMKTGEDTWHLFKAYQTTVHGHEHMTSGLSHLTTTRKDMEGQVMQKWHLKSLNDCVMKPVLTVFIHTEQSRAGESREIETVHSLFVPKSNVGLLLRKGYILFEKVTRKNNNLWRIGCIERHIVCGILDQNFCIIFTDWARARKYSKTIFMHFMTSQS